MQFICIFAYVTSLQMALKEIVTTGTFYKKGNVITINMEMQGSQ